MDYEGFTEFDAKVVVADYVCAVCEGDLSIVPVEGRPERLVVCPEHGNVESIGRITKHTVSIRNRRSMHDFPRAIRNLSEFWGVLIPTNSDRERTIKELGFF